MASLINASTSPAGIIQTADGTGILALQTGNTTALTIDASQNVGIGTTSPNQTGFTAPVLSVTNGTSGVLELIGTQASDGTVGQVAWYNTSGTARIGQILGLRSGANDSGAITFQTASAGSLAERMRINSASVGIGSTLTTSGLTVGYVGGNGWNINTISTTTAGAGAIVFTNPNGVVGSINTSGSTTGYSTSSDYRLKENIVSMVGALNTVAALKPVTYKWKVDGSDGQGFIAHELQEVVPQAVTGEKDAVDEDGNIKPQGVDTSFLVATLTAAIQEQQALITSLTARITALEGA